MTTGNKDLSIYLIAGETSGDTLGARMMHTMREICAADDDAPHLHFHGIGGTQMEGEGLKSLFPMSDLSLMGVAEILPRLQHLIRRINETVDDIAKREPDVVVTIDAPDFCFRVVKKLRERGVKKPVFIHYVAPTVWAWRPGRAQKVAALYDGLMCLFPFEPNYFTRHGLNAAFVGHPVMETKLALTTSGDRAKARAALGVPEDGKLLGLFFGSRMGEVKRMGGLIHDVALALRKNRRDLSFMVPTLPHLEPELRALLKDVDNVYFTDGINTKSDSLKALDAAVAVSGTVGLELGVANIPHVITYTMNPLTWWLVKMLIRVRFAHLANILLNKRAVPEFIQDAAKSEIIAKAVSGILDEGFESEEQRASFATMRKLLRGRGDETPSVEAAQFVLNMAQTRVETLSRPAGVTARMAASGA